MFNIDSAHFDVWLLSDSKNIRRSDACTISFCVYAQKDKCPSAQISRITELLIPVQIIFQDFVKDAKVLIDTGSRVDLLIQTSLFPKEALCQARHPISIRTADGSFMGGGSQGSFVSLRMPIRDTMSGDVTYVQFEDVWAYAADITNDVIL